MMPSRTVSSSLNIQSVIHAIDDDLRLSLRLHIAAHHTKRHPRLAILGSKSRNNRLKRPLPRLIKIRVAILKRKQFSAILKHKSKPIGNETRTHAAEV